MSARLATLTVSDLPTPHLAGTAMVPDRIAFPPTRIKVAGWPGWMTVDEAIERVADTLYTRLSDPARAERWDEVEESLDRLLIRRRAGWSRGVLSVDAQLKIPASLAGASFCSIQAASRTAGRTSKTGSPTRTEYRLTSDWVWEPSWNLTRKSRSASMNSGGPPSNLEKVRLHWPETV